MNWIYINIYRLALRTPSREHADEVAALFTGLFIAMHAEMAVLSMFFWRGVALGTPAVKFSALGCFVICLMAPFLYYQTFRNGGRLIESSQGQGSRLNLAAAVALVIETFMIPFVVVLVMIAVSR